MQVHMAQGQHPASPSGGTPPLSNVSGAKGPGGKAKRRVRNFLLQPLVQVRIGIYSILLSVLFAGALGAILYFNFFGLVDSVVMMTDAEDEVRDIFKSYWHGAQLWIYLT